MVAVRVLVRVQVSWLADQPSHHTGLDSGLAHPDIYLIYEILECVKGLVLLIDQDVPIFGRQISCVQQKLITSETQHDV